MEHIKDLMHGFLRETALKDQAAGTSDYFKTQLGIIREKPLLFASYNHWYDLFISDLKSVRDLEHLEVLELGSGSGFLKDRLPKLVTSDIEAGIAERVIDARSIPFPDGSLRAIFLANVFHHIPEPEKFLSEASRSLATGGIVALVEPTHTPFARLFYRMLHHEPYEPNASSWSFTQNHSMNDSNQALSWIVFFRDRKRFQKMFPKLRIEKVLFCPWLSYFLSGGVNYRPLLPRFMDKFVLLLDQLIRPFNSFFSLSWSIVIRKVD